MHKWVEFFSPRKEIYNTSMYTVYIYPFLSFTFVVAQQIGEKEKKNLNKFCVENSGWRAFVVISSANETYFQLKIKYHSLNSTNCHHLICIKSKKASKNQTEKLQWNTENFACVGNLLKKIFATVWHYGQL